METYVVAVAHPTMLHTADCPHLTVKPYGIPPTAVRLASAIETRHMRTCTTCVKLLDNTRN